MLAYQCAQNEPAAVDRVTRILAGLHKNLDIFLDDVRAEKAKELMQEYGQRDSDATRLVHQCLASAGVSFDSLVADALGEQFDYIERIDHLNTVAEQRRNAALREIDRPRGGLGEAVRRSVQEVEEGDFKVIEATPGKGKNAALKSKSDRKIRASRVMRGLAPVRRPNMVACARRETPFAMG